MSLFNWIESMRKKPAEVRQQFVAVTTLWIMGAVTAVWFVGFFSGLGDRLEKMKESQSAAAENAGALLQIPEFNPPAFSSPPVFPRSVVETPAPIPATTTASTSPTGE